MALTREQAAAAVAAAVAERDSVSANLLELDSSFGKRLLEGAALTGQTKELWDHVSGELAALWETFSAYSAAVDAADLGGRVRRSSGPELEKLASLLYRPSVQLTRAPRPLSSRDLTEAGQETVALATAVARMRRSFASVTEVVTAAEEVWNQVAGPLTDLGTALETATRRAAGLGDPELASALTAASGELASLRGVLNSDPLSLRHGGRVDTAWLDRLRQQARDAVARAQAVAAIRDDARRRIAVAKAAAAAASLAWQDAMAARDRAAAKILLPAGPMAAGPMAAGPVAAGPVAAGPVAAGPVAANTTAGGTTAGGTTAGGAGGAGGAGLPAPELARLAARAAALDSVASAGRWTALAAEIEAVERRAGELTEAGRAAERAAAGLLARRDELRGLLDAYQAKAARLGGAEDASLSEQYRQARDLLWSAPCDLDAATAAVTSYQRAISALDGRGRTQ